jgi:phosphate uptake regulator
MIKFSNDTKKTLIELSKTMAKEAITAFNNHDLDLANLVLKQDDEIDKIYSDLFRIIDHENFNRKEVKQITNILFIAKSFEISLI